MRAGDDPAQALAQRLRSLRIAEFPDFVVTQQQLAKALGVSPPLISSWEHPADPKPPPVPRLHSYARLFATSRSFENGRLRLIPDPDLTEDELLRREELEREFLALRAEATGDPSPRRPEPIPVRDPIGGGPWYFPDLRPVTIVCAQLPAAWRERMPYTEPQDPDYVALYSYADLDALVELHGHIRAVNPNTEVNIRLPADLTGNDYTAHLVLLGGVDWNDLTRQVLEVVDVPVSQVSFYDDNPDGVAFEVRDGDQVQRFPPTLRENKDGKKLLIEDVAHFVRGPNPYNKLRTVSICNGMFGRGTLGVVRTLTDKRFRDRNAAYLESRFPGSTTFSILSRVQIVERGVLTPDWTVPETRLHEWAEAA